MNGLQRTLTGFLVLAASSFLHGQAKSDIHVDWDKVTGVSRANATLQVVISPRMGPDSPQSEAIWGALSNLHADYVRYVPWLPYPKLAVAELEPPTKEKTSWDFSLIDPYTTAFLKANPQNPVILDFSTIPQWMFKTNKPVAYPADPNQIIWNYTRGSELRDPSMNELAGYYARLVSWYECGGFTDELGKFHASPHHFHFDYWEVLNEPDLEHNTTPAQYTERYDAIVSALRKVDPKMKFVGMALANPTSSPDFFEYFLDPKNHKPGIPLDMISYHFYAMPARDEPMESWQYTIFDQSARFVQSVKYVEAIRKRLSPSTKTTLDELGVIPPNEDKPYPDIYWNLCAAQYAYLYGEFARLGIDAVGASAMMQPPGFFPGVSMMNDVTAKPNARYWALKLIRENFSPGDKIVASKSLPTVYTFAVITADGKKRVLLANMRDHVTDITVPEAANSTITYVDSSTGYNPPATAHLTSATVHLQPFSVAVLQPQ